MFKYSSVPAWTIGGRSQGPHGNANPGPGNYDHRDATNKVSVHNQDPKWSVGKQPKGLQYGNANPGPGQYDSPGRERIVKGYMGAKTNDPNNMNVPGPGTYEEEKNKFAFDKAPAYTMRGKNNQGNKKNVPGPGQYDPDAERTMWKTYSGKLTSKAARDGLGGSGNPGPGNYDPANRTFAKTQGKFGRDPREGFRGNKVPGPGSYESQSVFDAKKGYSYGKDPRDSGPRTGVPGPGTYDYNASSLAGPAWKQGKQSRDWLKTSGNPGPGNYDAKNSTFSKVQGKINPEGRDGSGFNNPGPGTYDGDYTKVKDKNAQWSFGKEQKRDLDLGVPGPGTYDGHDIATRQSIAMDKRDKGFNYGNGNPGPGTYEDSTNAVQHTDAKYSFGKQARSGNPKKGKIGPGDYDIPHSIPDVAHYNYPALNHRKLQVYPDFAQF